MLFHSSAGAQAIRHFAGNTGLRFIMETSNISLYCPPMRIEHVGGRLYRTAVENMIATVYIRGKVVTIPDVVIPETDVHRDLLYFPTVAVVNPCVGRDAGGRVISYLPKENVDLSFRGWPPFLIAKAMIAQTVYKDDEGFEWVGEVLFPDCPVRNGEAQPITATGTLTLST